MKARNKKTGEIVEFTCIDNHFGQGLYGYKNHITGETHGQIMFDNVYEIVEDNRSFMYKAFNGDMVEDPNHPYGCMEVLDNVPKETWEDRFNAEFVDEDTGLLNIGKYDHDRLLNWINNEIK